MGGGEKEGVLKPSFLCLVQLTFSLCFLKKHVSFLCNSLKGSFRQDSWLVVLSAYKPASSLVMAAQLQPSLTLVNVDFNLKPWVVISSWNSC